MVKGDEMEKKARPSQDRAPNLIVARKNFPADNLRECFDWPKKLRPMPGVLSGGWLTYLILLYDAVWYVRMRDFRLRRWHNPNRFPDDHR
jgi:hypothetical protein